jgi:dolichol-phosphate mannosyltransferase
VRGVQVFEIMKSVIIIPTWNEKKNIGRLIEELQLQFLKVSHEMHILVVDDNSPDGTADIVKNLEFKYANVHLIQGQKAGLGAAYIRGMSYALNTLNAQVVIEMDADFQHKPVDVPRLLSAIDKGADFVIGSRYVEGGSIPKEWGIIRRMNSRYGNIVARYLAGLAQVRDCTAGFRAIRATLLKKIDLSKLKVQGYAFQVALLFEAMIHNAKIVEIPVDFVERVEGESKLGISDIIEFIANAWWLRLRASATFIKFLIVGASGVFVNIGLFSLLLYLGINKYISSPIAIEASILTNFALNNNWTFRWRETLDSIHIKGLKFNLVSLLALSISYGTFILLSLYLPESPPQLNQLIGIIPATFINYFCNSYWTFKSVQVSR